MENIKQEIFYEFKKLSNLFSRNVFEMKCKKKLPLTHSQGATLAYIIEKGEQGKVYQKDIEAHFGIRRSTASAQLHLLEEKGFITRKSSRLDSRLKEIEPTEKALLIKNTVKQKMDFLTMRLFDNLTDEQISNLKDIIIVMQNNIERRQDETISQ